MPIDTSALLYVLLAGHLIVVTAASVAVGLVLWRVVRRLTTSWRSVEEERTSRTPQTPVEDAGLALSAAN